MNLFIQGGTLSQRTIRSGLWALSFQLLGKASNSLKTIILARILAPSDFGLFGVALLGMSILDTFTQSGINTALVQKNSDTHEYLDTAWTTSFLRSIILFVLLFLLAPWIAHFFKNDKITPIIKAISFVYVFRGLANVGPIYFIKDLNFKGQLPMILSKVSVGLLITIPLSIILKNTWALVYGIIIKETAACIASYYCHPYRPKLSFRYKQARELFRFGRWVLGYNITTYILAYGDNALVGRILGMTALGLYQMAYNIANIPTTDFTQVISQVAFPAYAAVQNNVQQLRRVYFKTLQLVSFIALPLTGGIFVLSQSFVHIFLGEKWMPIVKTIQLVCIFGAIRAISNTAYSLFIGVGRPSILTKITSFQVIIMFLFIYPLSLKFGIYGVAVGVLLAGFIAVIWTFKEVQQILQCKHMDILKFIIYPLLATIVFIGGISMLVNLFQSSKANIIFFISSILLGVVIYFATMYLIEKRYRYGLKILIKDLVHAF